MDLTVISTYRRRGRVLEINTNSPHGPHLAAISKKEPNIKVRFSPEGLERTNIQTLAANAYGTSYASYSILPSRATPA